LQTIIQHASPEQVERWVRPSLEGKYVWCQMFSEPNAGSDAAAIRTTGERVEGGWVVTGQKVWTSGATRSDWGLATVRTDATGTKHEGITMMAIDLRSEGLEIRPICDASGREEFAEVFFDGVHVPDSDVVGEVGEGWRVARSTLGNERVSIGKGIDDREMAFELVELYRRHALGDRAAASAVGEHLAEARAMDLLNIRGAERAVAGGEPGPEASIAKLLLGEHMQRKAAVALELVGAEGTFIEGPAARVPGLYIRARSYTIAGGTSEILRNQIAERLLGLPRDPLIR
jgi:alkylation response protein AidB-like acyl-CoA dehydrogenase